MHLLQILREDVETALAESTLAQERAALMALEQQELQRQRDQLAGQGSMDCACCMHAAAGWRTVHVHSHQHVQLSCVH